MTEPDETWTEYGYRMPDGTEVWVEDHGEEGSWTPANVPGGLPYVIEPIGWDDTGHAFRSQLTQGAVMLTRLVAVYRGETQIHQ